ncbi:ubiquitin-conjugating enzyme E2-binding protein [Umbelopsis sp. AD052]|nr:ubiquitin-conjugating enzyme E2-binding protein [Umbelopsis sp. AD052]
MPGAGTLQDGPAVHAEVLGNIQSLLVVVNEPYSPDKYTLTSTTLLRDQTSILPFPTTVYPQDFKPQNVSDNAFSVRLRLAQSITVPHDSENTILNAKDLKDISTIKCRECNATLSDKAFPVVKDLPSEHWMELVECWICHETSEKEHSGKLQPIMAQPNLLLVSNTYLLFHPEDVQNVKLDNQCPPVNWDNVIAMKWIPMVCSACNSAVGEKQYRVSHNENVAIPNAEAIKLYKYAVQITMKENPANPFQFDASFQRYVAMDFIELFSAHATYKFLIYDRSDESIHGLIWVFNPDIQVYNSVSNIDDRWQRAMKVLYIDNEVDTAAASRHIEKWKIDKSVDKLTYPGKYCRELFAKLTENNLAIPEHLRKAPAGSPLADFGFAYLTR